MNDDQQIAGREPPNDADAEAALLGVVLIDPSALAKVSALRPEDFYSEAHRRIYEGCIAVRAAGSPVDTVTVGAWLRERDRISQVGGMGYLTEIINGAPAVANVEAYADSVRAKARRRELVATLHRVIAEGYCGGTSTDDLIASAIGVLEPLRSAGRTVTLAERVLQLGGEGQRLPFGLPTFDRATRGGVPVGKLVVAGGAPGAGKTTLFTEVGLRLARGGVVVGILAADEDADALAIRIGQLEGFERAALEGGSAGQFLAKRVEGLPLFLFDADSEGATVETVSAFLARERGERLSALIVDSVQTVRAMGSDTSEGPRARVDAVMASLKRCAKVDRHLVIATCELARGAYRSQSAADRIDDLAAFKESGGIEYGATVLLVLRSVQGGGNLVDVAMPKNRLGTKESFRLALDHERASFTEVEFPAAGGPAEAKPDKFNVACERIAAFVQAYPGSSKRTIRARISGIGNAIKDEAIESLLTGRQIVDLGKGKESAFHPVVALSA